MTAPDQPDGLEAGHRAIAARSGRYAGARGMDPSSCPHDPQGSPRERTLAAAWMRGYLHARPPAPGQVDHTGDEGDARGLG